MSQEEKHPKGLAGACPENILLCGIYIENSMWDEHKMKLFKKPWRTQRSPLEFQMQPVVGGHQSLQPQEASFPTSAELHGSHCVVCPRGLPRIPLEPHSLLQTMSHPLNQHLAKDRIADIVKICLIG